MQRMMASSSSSFSSSSSGSAEFGIVDWTLLFDFGFGGEASAS
jgi:hypothetical protein